MFSKFNSGFSKIPSEEIDFSTLAQLIRDNPNKEKILQIRELRSSGNVRYKNMKLQLPCVTVNSVVRRRKLGTPKEFEENFIKGSGYLYLDFDCGTVGDAIELKNLLVSEYGDKVAMVCFSSSMGGVSVLVRYAGIVVKNEYQFKNIREYIISNYFADLPDKFQIDESTKSVGQLWFISHDSDIFVNDNNVINLHQSDVFDIGDELRETSEKGTTRYNSYVNINITPSCTFSSNEENISKNINWETPVEVQNKIVDFKKIDYQKLFIPRSISDGNKRKTYLPIFSTFNSLNPNLPKDDVFKFLKFINQTRTNGNGMSDYEFERFIDGLYESNADGKLTSKTKEKFIHFNKYAPLNPEEKIKIANQLIGKKRVNETIMKIMQAKKELLEKSQTVTKSGVQRITGLSKTTVYRYWDSKLIDIDQMVHEINKKYS